MANKVTMTIAGEEYTFVADENAAYMEKVCGIGGMVQAPGSDVTLTTAVAGGVGFTAIIVAWLAQLNPPVILLVTFLFSVLEKGSSVVQSSFGLSSDCADVLQGIILFFILGCELFIRYQFVFRGKGGTRA